MDVYHIAKFVHLCSLIGAIATAAIVHLATERRDGARTIGGQLEWHSILLSAAKFFPIALLTLVASGAVMISRGGVPWSSGFVVGGLTGVVSLFVLGASLSVKGGAMKARLAHAVAERGAEQPPMDVRDPIVEVLQNMPVGIVLGVVFLMTTKPDTGTALSAIALGAAMGGMVGVMRGRITKQSSAAIMLVLLAHGQLAHAQTAANPIGVWRGTSSCLVRPSACKDEVVVYRITRKTARDSAAMDGRRIVNGQEEEMGVLGCLIAPSNAQLTCIIPRGVWQFRVRGDSLVGELRLSDSTKFRDVRTIRSR